VGGLRAAGAGGQCAPAALDRCFWAAPQLHRYSAALGALPYLRAVATLSHVTPDEAKRRANLRKRGSDLGDAERIFRGFTLTAENTREPYGERRFLTLGLLEDQVVSVAHTSW